MAAWRGSHIAPTYPFHGRTPAKCRYGWRRPGINNTDINTRIGWHSKTIAGKLVLVIPN